MSTQTRRTFLLVVLVVLATPASGCESAEEQLTTIRDRIEDAVLVMASEDAQRATAFEAIDQLAPSGNACTADIAVLEPGDARFDIVSSAEVGDTPGPTRAVFRNKRRELLAEIMLIQQPTHAQVAALSERTDVFVSRPAWDATVVATDLTRPSWDAEHGFTPGLVEGRIGVWDYENGRVVCVGGVTATNSPDVIDRTRTDDAVRSRFEADATAYLLEDLEQQVLSSAAETVAAVAASE